MEILNRYMEQELGTVYMWINLLNGKRRVGHTTNFNERLKNHIKESKNPKYPLQKAIKKYGLQNFLIESIQVPISEMLWLEKMWKVIYKTTNPEFGYDLMIDEEDTSGENNPMWGRKRPDTIERNKKMSGKNHPSWGIPLSFEQKQFISKLNSGSRNGNFGKYGDKNPNYGHHWTQEQKDKQSILTREKMKLNKRSKIK